MGLARTDIDVGIMDSGYVSSDDLNSDCNSDEDNGIKKRKIVVFSKNDLKQVKFEIGMFFSTADEFKNSLNLYCIQQGREVLFDKNASDRMVLYCADSQCKWRMRVARVRDEATVQIRTLLDEHSCERALFNRAAKPRFLANMYLDRVKNNPWWKLKAFKKQVGVDLEIQITTSTAFQALTKAKQKLHGNSADQYKLLWDYIGEVKRCNPGTTAIMKVIPNQGPNRASKFSRIYICWGSLKRGFIEGCRPLFGLDGTHLIGPHKGVLLTVVSIDANNCMYPFAYAVVDQEKYSTWKWFLKLLMIDLNIVRPEDYTVMSDKQKGLIKSVEKVLPGVEHRFCVRHLYNNFKTQHKGLALKNLLWKAARATTKPKFEKALDEMKALDPAAYEWLSSKPGEQWSKSHFQIKPKCDLLINNMCESFNSCIKEARGESILTMLEEIRIYLMDLMMRKNEAMKKYSGVICPKVHKKLEEIRRFATGYSARFNGEMGFEVDGPETRYRVDLEKWECGCNKWQLSGLPCAHAVAAINYNRMRPEDFVHDCYKKSTYMRTYSHLLMPMNGKEEWLKTGKEDVLPPHVEIKVGKQQKVRKRAADEPKAQSEQSKQVSRIGRVMRCSKCKKDGHNSRTCGRPPKEYKRKRATEGTSGLVDESSEEENMDCDDDDLADVRVESVGFTEENIENEHIVVERVGLTQPSEVQDNVQEDQTEIDTSFWEKVATQDELWNQYNPQEGGSMFQESGIKAHGSEGKKKSPIKGVQLTPTRRSSRIASQWGSNQPRIVDTTVHSISSSDEETTMEPQTQESVNRHGGTFMPSKLPKSQPTGIKSGKIHAGINLRPAVEKQLPKGHYEKHGKHFVSVSAMKAMAKEKISKKN